VGGPTSRDNVNLPVPSIEPRDGITSASVAYGAVALPKQLTADLAQVLRGHS
jgi:hypothetical protein